MHHSHQDVLLKDHLTQVSQLCRHFAYDGYEDIAEAIGLCHDLGKYTRYFQDKIKKKQKSNLNNSHAFISGIFTAHYFFETFQDDKSALPLLAFNVVRSHHQQLRDLLYDLPEIDDEKEIFLGDARKYLYRQYESLKEEAPIIKEELPSLAAHVDSFFESEEILWETLKKLKDLRRRCIREQNLLYYWQHLFLFSTLIAADKIIASGALQLERKIARLTFDEYEACKERYLNPNPKDNPSKLNSMRRGIYQKVRKSIMENWEKSKRFSITAPTGTGKTITGMMAAKFLQSQIGDERNIFYILPFTSIIDQNYEVIRKIHEFHQGFGEDPRAYLLKYHHLSLGDLKEFSETDENYDLAKALIMDEDWHSGIVVSTLVQFMYGLVGTKNNLLKKTHWFSKAIFVLDEVQAIPIKHYPLVRQCMMALTEIFDARIILMTATKPFILNDAIELLGEAKGYFQKLTRTTLHLHPQKISIDDYVKGFVDAYDSEKSYLIVCNTISQSLKMYQKIGEALTDKGKFYLSTNVIPLLRKATISEVKKLLDEEGSSGEPKPILISTQVVEAGVDLDFDEVHRDLGPIDAIIQCAGRCNRSWRRKNGQVHVFHMVNENGASYGTMVYGPMQVVLDTFGTRTEIAESEYFDLINAYYEALSEYVSQGYGEKFIESMKHLNYDPNDEYGIPNYKLIEEKNYLCSVFVVYDKEAQQNLEELKVLLQEEKAIENAVRIKMLRACMNDYMVSLPDKSCEGVQREILNGQKDISMLIINHMEDKRFYSKVTGVKRALSFEDRAY